jgi:hypothetical protein
MNADEAKVEIERLNQQIDKIHEQMCAIRDNECSHIDAAGNSTIVEGIFCSVCNKDIYTLADFLADTNSYIDSDMVITNYDRGEEEV